MQQPAFSLVHIIRHCHYPSTLLQDIGLHTAGTLLYRKRTRVPDAFGLLSEQQRALGKQLLPPPAVAAELGEEGAASVAVAEAEEALGEWGRDYMGSVLLGRHMHASMHSPSIQATESAWARSGWAHMGGHVQAFVLV